MVRSFVILLLLIVVFLGGMLLGIDREKSAGLNEIDLPNHTESPIADHQEKSAVEKDDNLEKEVILVDNSNNGQVVASPEHATQKIASFLETGVKGFYEVVVEILYHVTSLFV